MARPKTHDAVLRGRLLDRAAAVVSDGGVAALSLRRLAADARTSTTAVYSLFGGKAALLDELYREAALRFAARLATVAVTEDPLEDTVRLGLAYREYALAEPHLYSIMFGRAEVADGPQEEAEATVQPLLDAIRRGQAAGLLRSVPAERVALCCWGIAHGLVSLELTDKLPPGIEVAAGYEESLRAVIAGWRARA